MKTDLKTGLYLGGISASAISLMWGLHQYLNTYYQSNPILTILLSLGGMTLFGWLLHKGI